MSEHPSFIKVRAYLPLNPETDLIVRDGKTYPSLDYLHRLYTEDMKFREPIIDEMNEKIGLHNWAIKFIQHDEAGVSFIADIYCDDPELFEFITSVINRSITHTVIRSCYYKGTITDYLSKK